MTLIYFGMLAASGASTLAGVTVTSRSRNFAVVWALHAVALSLLVVAFMVNGTPLWGLLPAPGAVFCVRQWWHTFRRDNRPKQAGGGQ